VRRASDFLAEGHTGIAEMYALPEVAGLTRISKGLRNLAKSEKIAVVGLSQMPRPKDQNLNKRPTKFDLKESGSLENDSHTVLLIYRPVDKEDQYTKQDEIIIGKQVGRDRDRVKKAVPLDNRQITALLEWRRVTPYNRDEDWIFASPQMQGKQPFWPERLRKNLQAVVRRLGINKKVGCTPFGTRYRPCFGPTGRTSASRPTCCATLF
jgi:hypothetical protein